MSPFIWLDGALVTGDGAMVHVSDHALHSENMLTDGIRVHQRRGLRALEHLSRFRESSELLGLSIPWVENELLHASQAVVWANETENGYLRLIVWREPAVGISRRLHVAILAEPLEKGPEAGSRLGLSDWQRPDLETSAPKLKHYLLRIKKSNWKNRGADEGR